MDLGGRVVERVDKRDDASGGITAVSLNLLRLRCGRSGSKVVAVDPAVSGGAVLICSTCFSADKVNF